MRIQVSEDGDLTKLLQSRTDRAVKFAEMQKKQTGRDIADELGIPMEGIGAGTKSYFWINAFISEFIAALHYDKRNHIQSFILILVCVLPLEVITYLSNI